MKWKILLISILFASCSRKQFVYETKTVRHVDTVTVKSIDTVPCEDFETIVINNTDTAYITVVNRQVEVKYVRTKDTVYLTPNIVQPQPRKQVFKIDNSNTAKKGGIIGDGNTQDNRRQLAWWWIFLAGGLSM